MEKNLNDILYAMTIFKCMPHISLFGIGGRKKKTHLWVCQRLWHFYFAMYDCGSAGLTLVFENKFQVKCPSKLLHLKTLEECNVGKKKHSPNIKGKMFKMKKHFHNNEKGNWIKHADSKISEWPLLQQPILHQLLVLYQHPLHAPISSESIMLSST